PAGLDDRTYVRVRFRAWIPRSSASTKQSTRSPQSTFVTGPSAAKSSSHWNGPALASTPKSLVACASSTGHVSGPRTGSRSAAAFLVTNTRCARGDAYRRVRVAREVEALE